jgi:hypothetical protein
LEEGPWRNLNGYCKKIAIAEEKIRSQEVHKLFRLEMVCRLKIRYTLFHTKIVPPLPLYFKIQSKIMTRLHELSGIVNILLNHNQKVIDTCIVLLVSMSQHIVLQEGRLFPSRRMCFFCLAEKTQYYGLRRRHEKMPTMSPNFGRSKKAK